VMTWNVENLFRPGLGADAAALATYQQKLALLAAVVNGAQPDVLALQEVGGEEPLLDLQQALAGALPHRAVSRFPDDRGIRVAFLSRHALVGAPIDIVDFPPGPALAISGLGAAGQPEPVIRMARGALHVRVTPDGQPVDLITAHLKSKLLTFRRPGGASSFQPRDEGERAQVGGIALLRRTAEAVTLRIRANALLESNSQTRLLLLGDFNDVPEAQTSLLLTGPPGSEIGTGGFDRDDAGDDARLFNLAPAIAAERRFSRKHHGRPELLDQILASVELLPRGSDGRRRRPAVDSLVDFSALGTIESVGDDPNARRGEIAPDHAPVLARFEL
jgi:endonuclease/exonuclease/phosphatase family metal-dependent hydrolase